jgi:hypothetical protein
VAAAARAWSTITIIRVRAVCLMSPACKTDKKCHCCAGLICITLVWAQQVMLIS